MFKKISYWLASFLELQLVISLTALPILIHWGLAISYMSLLGNFIFTPLLTAFLWCSSLFTLCSIAHIPCSWLTKSLDILSYIWNYFLSFARPTWLIGFCHSTIWLSLIIALFIFVFYTLFNPSKKVALTTLSLCSFILLCSKYATQKNQLYQIDNLPLYVLQANNKTYLIDNGALCKKQNFYSWIDYKILPELIKTAGITTVNTLVLYKPNKRLTKIVPQFAQQTNIKTILVTTQYGCYHELKKTFQNDTITIKPILLKKIY